MIEDNEDATQAKFPFVIPLIMILLPMMVGGAFLKGGCSGFSNPDPRTAEEMARDVLLYQHRQNSKATGKVTDEKVAAFAKMATCQMELMGFWEGKEPTEPEPPKEPHGHNPVDWIKYKQAQKSHKLLLKLLPKRKKLWAENNETRGEYVFLAGKEGRTKEERQKGAAKYRYLPNLYGYVLEARYFLFTQMLKQLKKDPDFGGSIAWITQEPEDFIREPLAPVLDCDNKPMLTWDGTSSKEDADQGQPCLLLRPIAEAVTRANKRMCDDQKGQIMMKVCYRNNLHQSVLYVSIAGEGCGISAERSGISLPGNSHHGIGAAFDCLNQGQAEDYLAAEGIACGFIKDDEGHCSLAEMNPNTIKGRWKKKYQNWKDRWKKGKDIYDSVRGK